MKNLSDSILQSLYLKKLQVRFFISRKEKKLQNLAIRKSLLQQKVNIFLVWLNRTAKLASRKVFSVKSSVPYVLLQVILIYSFLNIIQLISWLKCRVTRILISKIIDELKQCDLSSKAVLLSLLLLLQKIAFLTFKSRFREKHIRKIFFLVACHQVG